MLMTTTTFKPIADRVFVQRVEEEEKTSSGLVIPDVARERPTRGRVLAVGPGRRENGAVVPLDVKVGDLVLFGKYSGSEIEVDGQRGIIMREDELLGVIDDVD
jgi:chaperonin GroES